jgi:hypothetical protein
MSDWQLMLIMWLFGVLLFALASFIDAWRKERRERKWYEESYDSLAKDYVALVFASRRHAREKDSADWWKQ